YSLDEEKRSERISNLMEYRPPCIIITDNEQRLEYLPKYCKEENIPLLRTTEQNYEFIKKIDALLINRLAQEISDHGACVNEFGVGVFIRGSTGVGKSETAHSLVGRWHRLVVDDIVV